MLVTVAQRQLSRCQVLTIGRVPSRLGLDLASCLIGLIDILNSNVLLKVGFGLRSNASGLRRSAIVSCFLQHGLRPRFLMNHAIKKAYGLRNRCPRGCSLRECV